MKKTIYLIVLLFITSTLLADWDLQDGYKMHFPQYPDPTGYDVNCTTDIIGDDWQCTEDGWICDIHIWISWQEDIIGSIQTITATIYNNIPIGPEGYSIPDMPLWSQAFTPSPVNPPNPGEFWIRDEIYNGQQGWYDPDPMNPVVFNPDHTQYFQVNMVCDYVNDACFWQTAGEIYWLVIEIETLDGTVGWKTSIDHFMDDGVYFEPTNPGLWTRLINPPPFPPPYDQHMDLAFVVNGQEEPCPVELSSFTALCTNGNAILNWTTQTESNNLGWNVYRSLSENLELASLVNYDLIPGAGTATEPTDYTFTDISELENNTSYWYWLESTSCNGETDLFGPVTLTIQFDDNQVELPTETILLDNYPNPFNPDTNIEFSVKEGESGIVTIYNAKGQLLETHQFESGEHQFKWDAAQYGSGIYFYKLETQSYTETKKMIMLK